jgi:hypothetical protein
LSAVGIWKARRAGSINDLVPNDLDLNLERDEGEMAWNDLTPARIGTTPLAPSWAKPLADAVEVPERTSLEENRVAYIKVLADGEVIKTREFGE